MEGTSEVVVPEMAMRMPDTVAFVGGSWDGVLREMSWPFSPTVTLIPKDQVGSTPWVPGEIMSPVSQSIRVEAYELRWAGDKNREWPVYVLFGHEITVAPPRLGTWSRGTDWGKH